MFPPAEFLTGNEKYDLVINVDSLTEMDPNIARAYWNQIESNTNIFLSINHEAHTLSVRELIDGSTRVVESERAPYWMRRGFVEEVIRFKSY